MSPSNKNCYVNNVGENHKTSNIFQNWSSTAAGMLNTSWDWLCGMLTFTIIIIVELSVC